MGSLINISKKILNQEKILLTILIVLVILPYLKVLNGFFQQDEWSGFAWFILNQKSNFLETIKFFFSTDVGHYNPLALSIQYLFYYLWGIDYSKYAIFGIVLHSLVTIAVYFLAKVLFDEKKTPAFFVALLFGIFASTHQGVSWAVVNISTLGAAFFGVISTTLFFLFLKKEKGNYLGLSLVFFVISLLFKETTLGLFLLFFLLAKKKRFLIVAWGLAYMILRIAFVFISRPGVWGESAIKSSGLIFQNFLTVPIKSIAQIFIPGQLLKEAAFYLTGLLPTYMTGIPGSPEFEGFAVRIILSFLSILIGTAVLIVLGLKFKKFLPFVGLGWVIINSWVFSFAPETKESVSLVDSRNLYFASIGFAIFVVSIADIMAKKSFKKFFILLLPLIILNIFLLNSNLSKFANDGMVRKRILTTIKRSYPSLPDKVIFYTQSDSSYYGLSERTKILPFQSGLGQTLLVLYSQTEKFPKEFFAGRFLWDIDSQGYKEIQKRGFGYFRDYLALKATLTANKLDIDSIISYSWEGKLQKLTNTTNETRNQMKKQ